MKRIYPKEVKQHTSEIIKVLKEAGFFEEEELTDTTFTEKYINDILTEKFIAGEPLNLGTEKEIDDHLNKIIGGSICHQLKEQGFLDSYEDEDTKEIFFLTEKGKELKKNLLP